MSNVLEFKKHLKGSALVLDDNFCPDLEREMLIDWVINIKTKRAADEFITALYNEGVLFGHVTDKPVLIEIITGD